MAVPNVNEFKTNLPGAGARANLFEVELSLSIGGTAQTWTSFWVKAGQIPGSTIAILPVNHGGRVLKIPGLRTFDDWTCTVMNDNGMVIKGAMIDWMMDLAGYMDGDRGVEETPSGGDVYRTEDIKISQYDQEGVLTQTYTMHEAWPNAIADTPVDWGTDGLQEFGLTFSYDWWSHTTISAEKTLNLEGTTSPGLPT